MRKYLYWASSFLTLLIAPQLSIAESASSPKPAADQPAAVTPPRSAEQLIGEQLDHVLAGNWRSSANQARDRYRHPKETLQFFGLKPDMQVIEITPGSGWYTEILAPFLKGQGKLIAAIVNPNTSTNDRTKEYLTKSNADYRAKLSKDVNNYGSVEIREFAIKTPNFGPANSADMLLTFRNVHNWMMWGNDQTMFQGFYKVLKPGGILGITDHRAAAGTDLNKIKDSGYIPEDYVIKLATDAGFKLVAKSDINANPKDTKNYPKGVWTLPPTLTEGEKDKEKYLAIGESDRMTLKFVKPQGDAIFKQSDSKKSL